MHKYGMDICLYINHIKRLNTGEHVADVSWYNLGYSGFPWLIHNNIITIKNTQNWIDISDKFMHTRTQSGLPK